MELLAEAEAEAEAADKELEQLRRNLANALAEEVKIIYYINKLENCIKTERYNGVNDLNTSITHERTVAHVNDVQNRKNSSIRSEFLEHVLVKHVLDLDTILSGVEFKVHQVHGSPDGIKYMFTIESRQVEFFLQFLWLEHSNSLKHTQVEFPLAIHRAELAPLVRTLKRQNNVLKIIRVVTDYSEAFDRREKILREITRKFRSSFKYEISENGGYDFEISDQATGKKYFEANWTITLFKKENKMDHNFTFSIDEEAHTLSDAQKEIFETLTRGSGNSSERLNIRKLIEHLVRGFSNWLQD